MKHLTSSWQTYITSVHPKNSNHFRLHSGAIMALDHNRLSLENKLLKSKSGRIFCVRQVYFTKSCQQILYTLYTSHLRWNSIMRHCIYYTNLGKNAKSHNYSRQIALIQYSGRLIVGFLRNLSKKISKITQYTASRFSNLQKCERWSGVWMKTRRTSAWTRPSFGS